jgi:hypothetical protein
MSSEHPPVKRAYKGFRAIIWDGSKLYLQSPTFGNIWCQQPDGTWRLRAQCYRKSRSRTPCTEPPSKSCGCGVYASYDDIEAIKYSRIIGLVRPVGRTIPAEDGWRAEAAVVELLAVPDYIRPELPPAIRDRVCTYDLLRREQSVPLPTAAESRSFRGQSQAAETEELDDFRPPVGAELACYRGVFYVSAWVGARSYTRTYCRGSLYCEEWEYNGQPHREGGPARISYWPDGRAVSCTWFRHGEMYREDGPPMVLDPDGEAIGMWPPGRER